MQPRMGVGWHGELLRSRRGVAARRDCWHAGTLRSKGMTQICKLLTTSRTDIERLFLRLLLSSSPCQQSPHAELRLPRNIIPTQDGDTVAGKNGGGEFLCFGADDETVASVRAEEERVDVMNIDLGLE